MNYTSIRNFYKKSDPVIYSVIKDLDFTHWLKPTPTTTDGYFAALCREIIGQQLSGKAASTISKRFFDLLPSGAPQPGSVLALSNQAMRDVGLSWAKVSYVKNIAQAFVDNQINAAKLHEWSDEEVVSHVTQIKGVGRWTAEMFLLFVLGREDIFSYGDLGLKRGLEKLYNLSNPSKAIVEPIITKWSPYKSYGSIALWQSLEK